MRLQVEERHYDMGLYPTEKTRYRLERPVLLPEALSGRKQLVLLGGPGSGKSSFLRHLAVALADDAAELPASWNAGRLLPLYASLGAFAAWAQGQRKAALDGPGLWRYLLATAQEYGLKGLDAAIERAFRQGGLLLLLDGLDEVAEPQLRAGVARAVAALAEAGGHVAVTCRARSFEGAVAAPFAAWGAPETLAPFSLGQMHHFVRAWYTHSADRNAIEHDDATRRAAELCERLANVPDLRALGQTPLLLTIMTLLHFHEGKLPEDRADLYEDLVQLFLIRWTTQRREAGAPPGLLEQLKQEPRLSGLKEYHLRHTLEALAYHAHQQSPSNDGRGLLDRDRVRGDFQRLFEEFDLGPGPVGEKTALVLTHLEHESGLLLPEGGELYGLPHLSYEEYLGGCYLGRQANFRTLAYGHWQADPSRWREVIFLALGRMVRGEGREAAAAWLEFLLAALHGERVRDASELQRAAFFAHECLDQMGGKVALIGASTVALPKLWTALSSGLAGVVEGAALPAADRVRAGGWLGTLGDPRVPVTRDEWRIAGDPVGHPTSPLAVYWRLLLGGSFGIGLTGEEIKRLPKDEQGHFSDTLNEPSVVVDSFALARFPVTNAQYAAFVDAGGYDPDAPWWRAEPAGQAWLRNNRRRQPDHGDAEPNYPAVEISWFEAMAFCRWLTHHLNDGYVYQLPSEAEWEYAARGLQRRMYAWGDAVPDGERASYNRAYNGTSAVGCFTLGATPEGVLDLAGNVYEWTRSEYRAYPYDPGDGREAGDNPAKKHFTLRGGSWLARPIHLRAASRTPVSPGAPGDDVGLRLARHRV